MIPSKPASLFPLVCCLFAVTAPARAALATGSVPLIITEQTKLFPSGEAGAFGHSVAVSGDTAVVGSTFNGPMGQFTGAAYIFVRNGSSWSEQARLSDDNPFFGGSVAISGETVVVGAIADPGTSSGAAYVFVRDGSSWSLQAKLSPADSSLLNPVPFGGSVAIDGDTAIVGHTDSFGGGPGTAYVFVRSGSSWSEQARLFASDGEVWAAFGSSVAISGDSVAVGARYRQDFRGAAYIFARSASGWAEQAQLLAPDGEWGDHFGASVAISGGTAVVGAIGADQPGTGWNTGAAYVFQRIGSSWLQQAELQAADGKEGDGLGRSVALSGDTLTVGAVGKVYAYVRGGMDWYERAELVPSDPDATAGNFGRTVALSGNTVFVGAGSTSSPWTAGCYVFSPPFSPGVAVNPGVGLVTTEWGGTAQFFVTLNSPPAGDVMIDLASSHPGEGTVSPAQLRFTPQDWFGLQTATLTGVDDFVKDGNQPYSVVVSMNTDLTTDPVYLGIDPPDISAANLGLEGDFYTITPCRVLDTRLEQDPIFSGVKRLAQIHDICGIPTTAGAIALNVTVVGPTTAGTLRLCPGDLAPASFSLLYFQEGQIRSGNAIVLLAADNTGTLAVWPTLLQGGFVHVVIDISGYFE